MQKSGMTTHPYAFQHISKDTRDIAALLLALRRTSECLSCHSEFVVQFTSWLGINVSIEKGIL